MPIMMKRKDGTITPFRNAEYLSAYYFIPKRILEQCGKELNSIPRNPQKLICDYNAVAVVESDLFIQLMLDAYAYMVWPYMCPGEYMEVYSGYDPAWIFAHSPAYWVQEMLEENVIPKSSRLLRMNGDIDWITEAEVNDILLWLVPQAMAHYGMRGGNTMIAGHLQIKNDYYYMVLSYMDSDGKRKQPWIPTGLPVKGNKKRAEKMLIETRQTYVPPVSNGNRHLSADMLFADYMETWLEIIRGSVEKTTFSSYTQMVKKKIVPYFHDTGLTLGSIQAKHIQSFYLHELKSVSASTVIHEHANIHKALKYAVKMDLIPFNPADKVERPKKQKFIAGYYRLDELERLFEVTKDHPYSLLIQMTAFYGLRRSEALGLRWDAIDFERNTITIKHIVTNAKVDGKCEIVCADRAKTKSSLRSLPLVSNIRDKLLALKEQQKENKRICGNCYNKEFDGYVFVDAMGNIFNPRSVSANFSKLLQRNNLRHIRFHDLRHSCASLLLANDVPMKQIQEWLGHSDISTTANIYSHLDYKSKITSANVMDNILVLPNTKSQGW